MPSGAQVGIGGGGGGTISYSMVFARVQRVLQGGGRGTEGIRFIKYDSVHIIFATDGTG